MVEIAFYYYFTPFSVVFITYLAGGSNNNNENDGIKVDTTPLHQTLINCTLATADMI
jgi:hypothetical protein